MADSDVSWLDRAEYPFEDHFVEIDGNRIHYVDEGQGPLLLMLHGNPTWSFVYRDVIKDLSTDFRCLAPDLAGFGLSTAADGFDYLPGSHAKLIARFIEQLDLSGVTLVVQDWGGPIGLSVAEQIPERFSGLVIGNTWAWPVNGDRHFEIFSWVMGGPIGRPLIRKFNLFVNALIPTGHRRRKVSKREMTHYREPLATAERREASAIFPRAIIHSHQFLAQVEAGLPTIASLPALLIWADKDIAFRAKERERFEAVMTDSQTVIVGGAGHYVQSDAPEEFAGAIRTWWQRARE